MQILQCVLSADGARKSYFSWEFPGPVTKLLAQMAVVRIAVIFSCAHSLQVSAFFLQASVSAADASVGSKAMEFWISVLMSVTNWNRDRNVLYVMDQLLEMAYTLPESWDAVLEFFYEKVKVSSGGRRRTKGIHTWV